MKSLVPYKGDCFEIHKKAVNKKQSGALKNRLSSLDTIIESSYKIYLENFNKGSLKQIEANFLITKYKDDLLSLYKYQSKVIIEVRESIRKLQIKTIISTCQNCTIDSVNSLDHLLPKSAFPEYVVNPINLFPCCTTCNSLKNNSIENDSGQKFLNLYLDILPKSQYLFVNVFYDKNGDLDFRFYLKNTENSISLNIFSVIENHYDKLHLFERFKFKSIEYVSELESKISAFRRTLTIDDIVMDLTLAANDEKKAFGDNHWKCILELALINCDLFLDKFR